MLRHIICKSFRRVRILFRDGIQHDINFRPSRCTQANMVEAATADSSQRRFITICLSKGAKRLAEVSDRDSRPYREGKRPENRKT